MSSILRTVIAALLLTALPAAAQEGPAPETDEQKTLYALGQLLANNLGQFALSAEELAYVEAGIHDGVLGNDSKVDLQTYGPKVNEMAQKRSSAVAAAEKTAGAEYLKKEAAATGAETTDSGLIYTEITAGTGASPTAEDTVKVHYHGTLRDGKVFDSSVERGQPATFPLNRVIPCWTEAVQKMKVGGKSKIVCPPDIAYGDRGAPPSIPPGATLTFEVELLEISGN